MNAIVLFTKFPKPGHVKTRLAKGIGNEAAAEIQRILLLHLVKEHSNQQYKLVIAANSQEEAPLLKNLLGNHEIIVQQGKDLGERMSNAFKTLLPKYEKVCIIGADCPTITNKTIERAFAQLDSKNIVLGPAEDGGYYLVAMKHHQNIFNDIIWSTSQVLKETLERIKQQDISYSLLEKMRDIDEVEDLEFFKDKMPELWR